MKIAIMGYGNIGSGVAEILDVNAKVLEQRQGEKVELKYILDLRDFPGDKHESCLVKDYKIIAADKEVDVVVETMGGVEPAFTFVKAMLESGKSVCTSNKALVAAKGAELIAVAKEHDCNFMFEASVGGGIPIIRTITDCLTADVIDGIYGIVNGTTNFMLTKMSEQGMEYNDVLKEAQALGYAEKDPTADVEGYDSCRKIAILASLVAGQQVDYEDIPTEGISKISAVDIKYIKLMGRAVKLLATMTKKDGKTSCRVAPYIISTAHPLFNVNDVFNAVMVTGNMLGDGMFYGSGAGKLPTASAVVADVMALGHTRGRHIPLEWRPEKLVLSDAGEDENRFFVRSRALEADIENIFGKVEILDAMVDGEVGFITGKMKESEFAERCKALKSVISAIRYI